MGIAVQKLLKNAAGLLGIVQIVFVNFADSEQRVATILAARILPPQKLVLGDGLMQNLVVIEAPPHLDQRLSHGHHAGISLHRGRRAEINIAVGVDHPLVVVPRAVDWRTSVERFPHALGGRKVVASPGFGVMDAGISIVLRSGKRA